MIEAPEWKPVKVGMTDTQQMKLGSEFIIIVFPEAYTNQFRFKSGGATSRKSYDSEYEAMQAGVEQARNQVYQAMASINALDRS